MFSLVVEGTDKAVQAGADESLLDACLSRSVPLPYNCRSGECGECLARLVSGEVHELPGADPAVYSDAMRSEGMILTCMCFARSDVVISVPLRDGGDPRITEFDAVIENVTWFDERTAKVLMRCPAPVEFRSGQYFEWLVPGTSGPRAYSAANACGSSHLEFLVRVHPGGEISSRLKRHELASGDVVSLRGPYGAYAFNPRDDGNALFVAGGTGLAPVKSIVEAALQARSTRPMVVFYGARNRSELQCAQALSQWAAEHRQLRFVPVLSEEPADSAWTGRRGTVIDAMKEELGESFGAQAYLCGPPVVIELATALLERQGVFRADIYCDKFVPAMSREGA
ncbi:2Fe-2S iron-sulfur cluster-binding protein [Lacisediminimonas profundi]|uniref:2Fe-2S iron-sulfur cluster-binding protein n=1 Tax=Lacisediminimonas profundi TaxID=2603856 RepID=UPI00124B33F6|nr:2Fe-2S iron-sulfur cluster-binding protein [Lacisediminimonas profundi]